MRRAVLLMLVACGAPPAQVPNPVGGDAGTADAGATAHDAGGGPQPVDAGAGDAGLTWCDYQPVDNFAMWCATGWTWLHHAEAPGCPGQVSARGRLFASVADAAGELGCNLACVYREHQAVQFVYCKARGEFSDLVPGAAGQVGPGTGCSELYYYVTVAGRGFYTSHADFEAANPCP